MDSIVHTSIDQVTQNKTGEKHESIFFQEKILSAENDGSQDQAGYRGHEQSLFVTGVFMVITMHYINELSYPGIFATEMEQVAVHNVFEECPEKHGPQKYRCYPAYTKTQCCIAVV